MPRYLKILILVLSLFISGRVFSQVDTINWTKKSPLPQSSLSACQMGYFLIDSDFYIAGGWLGSPGNIYSNNVWRYHITTDTWYQMSNLPFGGAATSCTFVLNGKGYFLTSSDSASNFSCDNMFWEYDPSGDRWTQLANYPFDARQNSSFFVCGGKAYVGQTDGCSSDDNDFWEYDPVLNQWAAIAALPPNIIAGSAAIAAPSASAYLVCGFNPSGTLFNDMWRYITTSNNWDSIGQVPGALRAYPIMWDFDSTLVVGGGYDGTNFHNDYYKYDIVRNIWTPIIFQNFIDSVAYSATFIYNKTAYYFGGPSDLIQTTHNIGIWSFDASRYIHDTPTGIAALKNEVAFSVYPNPASHEQAFSISTSESGSISFYDALGRMIDDRKITRGSNQIKLSTDDEVVIYRAMLSSGSIEIGKVVFYR